MAKPKKVSYEFIRRDTTAGHAMYPLLHRLVEEHHGELLGAKIALAWNTSWKADVDGRVTLGKCKKASDLDRELADFDFVILLRQSFWENAEVTDRQRSALLDHELCHATVAQDERGDPKRDERDRIVYRIRKHDIEEFASIVERYGCYKSDLEAFARAIERGPRLIDTDNDGARAALKRLQRLAARDGGSMELTTTIDGRDVGTRITRDAVEPIDRPAKATA